ncbi:MAG: small multi-drug export protein [Clostridiales Family XIII bacterium]|jgi:uncharacterized membrane protein|nr:small multi-drug export protein [Clostridiales Family XIII bacterium]
MLPIFELRGGIVFARLNDIPFFEAFVLCFIGNILPVPIILLFLRQVFKILERNKYTGKFITKLENKARKNHDKFGKYELLGLFFLVAIPLPGTGAWTGSLVAVIFDFQIKKAFPIIALGVLAAGIIMLTISYAIPGFFFQE